VSRVRWRGVLLDSRTAAMMDEVARLVGPDLYVRPTQGSYSGGVSASAGTHDGGGAIDLAARDLTPGQRARLVAAMRRVGFAAWLRTPAQSDWPYHVHGVAVGCPDLSRGAANQVRDYLNGLNGLAGKGRDDGPREHAGTTWEQYRKQLAADTAPGPTPEELMAMKHQVIFFTHKSTRYAAYPMAGVYRRIPDPGTEKSILNSIGRCGGSVLEWAAGKEVDNPAAFGVEIG
jgi:hypothetical protein